MIQLVIIILMFIFTYYGDDAQVLSINMHFTYQSADFPLSQKTYNNNKLSHQAGSNKLEKEGGNEIVQYYPMFTDIHASKFFPTRPFHLQYV